MDPIISTPAKINYQLFSMVFASSVSSCLCFSSPPTLFLQGFGFLNQASFYSCEVSSFFSFNVLPGGSHEDALLVRHFSLIFLLRWIQFEFSVLIIFFSLFQMFSHAGAPLNHPLLTIQLFRSAEDILEDSSFYSKSFQAISRSYLIQAI